MRFINEIKVDTSGVNQNFELGDLTIFIGRPNCGKTRILQEIYIKANQARGWLEQYKLGNKNILPTNMMNHGIDFDKTKYEDEFLPRIISSDRQIVDHIDAYSSGFEKINQASKKMDPTIIDIGNNEVNQKGSHRPLRIQGSGIQNMVQILSNSFRPNFLLIDEPEISQFPSGKIEMLRHLLDLLQEKQIILTTHDPTLINQYIIKKFLKKEDTKIIVYSFCIDKFNKIDFNSNLNPEIHCGYLNQTLSGKPIHLILEGQTDYYAFQALLHKYCLENNEHNMAKNINNISIGFLGGIMWKVNIHHLPPPELYDVLVILDGEYTQDLKEELLPPNSKIVNSTSQIESGKINIMTLKAINIEKAFENIFEGVERLSKPLELSERIWKEKEKIIEKLNVTSENSKQIYEIINWAVTQAKKY
ncbi:ATP-binding protein [Candidatus Pacearchaeota archaeon]|jgi:energy-coupling factor transporter ATP-binding protein EcfA2|nr:ATP-binding protein [Candidatus Pacearchaeota archaeon]